MGDLEKSLANLGITLKDDNGRCRSVFDILDELSLIWQKTGD